MLVGRIVKISLATQFVTAVAFGIGSSVESSDYRRLLSEDNL